MANGDKSKLILGEEEQNHQTHNVPFGVRLTSLAVWGTVVLVLLAIASTMFNHIRVKDMRSELSQLRQDIMLMRGDVPPEDRFDQLLRPDTERYYHQANDNFDLDESDEFETDIIDEVNQEDSDEFDDSSYNNKVSKLQLIDVNSVHERLRRDATEAPTERSQRRKKSKKAKRSKKRRTQEVMHLIPHNKYVNAVNHTRHGGDVEMDCGDITQHGVVLKCARAKYWEVDSDFSDSTAAKLHHGVLVVKKTGLYLIYSQMTYFDALGMWSFAVNRTRNGRDEMLSQCSGMEPHYSTDEANQKTYAVQFQCHTSFVARLERHDHLSIYNMYYTHSNRVLKLEKHLTFWGLVRLGD